MEFEGIPLLFKRYGLPCEHIWLTFSLENFSSTTSHVLLADSTPESECFCAAALSVVEVGKNTEC